MLFFGGKPSCIRNLMISGNWMHASLIFKEKQRKNIIVHKKILGSWLYVTFAGLAQFIRRTSFYSFFIIHWTFPKLFSFHSLQLLKLHINVLEHISMKYGFWFLYSPDHIFLKVQILKSTLGQNQRALLKCPYRLDSADETDSETGLSDRTLSVAGCKWWL